MSHFLYCSLKTKEDKIGVWLRPYTTNTNLKKKAKKIGRVRFYEIIDRIVVTETRTNNNENEVFLEVWLVQLTWDKLFRSIFNLPYKVERYVVFGWWEKEDGYWVCEGDLGKGLKD